VLELAGIAAVVVAAFLVWPVLGVAALGVALFAVGYVLEDAA